jgi:3-hydroxy acid dehydrogenase/malonic semialdehyde reductase
MNPIALITGATAGIGKACAGTLARNRYDVIITGRRQDRLDQLAGDLLKGTGSRVKALCFDIRDRHTVEQQLGSLPPDWKAVEVLVNNAGGAHGLDLFQEADVDDWETMIDANVKGLLYISRIISGWMIEGGKGHIVNISSIAGKEVYEKGNVYCATKAAVDALTRGMRIDMLQHGIRVTSVDPGMVETEFSMVRFKGDREKADKVYEGLQPLTAGDVAEAVWFAVSRPPHVCINDLLIMPTAQASMAYINRKTE